jgi:hypothetical protein
MSNWYPSLASYSFPTVFVKLRGEELEALSKGDESGPAVDEAVARLDHAMKAFSGNRFVSVDLAAPTDSDRFASKRGAVHSALSAWHVLASSAKVRNSVAAGFSKCIAVRPFRRMDVTREFRLFIKDGALRAMSQYWLVRHFRRLEGRRELYWSLASEFVSKISWCLPSPDIVMDIYFTSGREIIVVDLNPWGDPTDPLMLRNWAQDWNSTPGLKLIPSPAKISGDVNVSF